MTVAPGVSPREGFIRATYALAKRDPQGWAEFLVAFDMYTNDELALSTSSSVDTLALSVGGARRLVSLRQDFNNLEDLMKRFESLRVKKQEQR